MTDIKIPRWGLTMDEATIIKWKKSIDDYVDKGDVICEIQSDKAEGLIESPVSGIVKEILFDEDETVEVGVVIARIYSEDEM